MIMNHHDNKMGEHYHLSNSFKQALIRQGVIEIFLFYLVIFYFHIQCNKCTEKASICRHILNNKNIIATALKK